MGGFPYAVGRYTTTPRKLITTYGTHAFAFLGKAQIRKDLGEDFGENLTSAELVDLRHRVFGQNGTRMVTSQKIGRNLSRLRQGATAN